MHAQTERESAEELIGVLKIFICLVSVMEVKFKI
jgi:hypothetical protein